MRLARMRLNTCASRCFSWSIRNTSGHMSEEVETVGVDGIGWDANGRGVGLVRCKWTYYGEDVAISAPDTQGSVRQVLAALIHPVNVRPLKGIEFWSRSAVASRVVQHADRLPLAMSLRIKHSASVNHPSLLARDP